MNTIWSHIIFEHTSTLDTLAMDPRKKKDILDDLITFSKSKRLLQGDFVGTWLVCIMARAKKFSRQGRVTNGNRQCIRIRNLCNHRFF
ncbi:hypothetical protein HanPSC8_Chr07g0305201 [Helianthus annuus]|nr:hypothetical protein HanPSC8_Chr07g0305201 [Helianthus annuus]